MNLASGLISTVAGNGTAGYNGDGGPATAAEMDYPWNVAVDGCGDFFIADYRVNAVREVDLASGVITTAAGDGLAGYAGNTGPATAAYLSEPASVACDAAGDLFIADAGNCVIREVAVGAPGFMLSGPISGTFADGQSITIQWTAGYVEAGHNVTISLGYDADTAAVRRQPALERDQPGGGGQRHRLVRLEYHRDRGGNLLSVGLRF